MSTATENKPSVNNTQEPKTEVKAPDFGKGKYSAIAESLFNSSQFFLGLTPVQAEKVAKSYASDLGRLNMSVDAVKVAKPSKEGTVTIRENGIVKKINCTPAMLVSVLVDQCAVLYKLGAKITEVKITNELLADWLK